MMTTVDPHVSFTCRNLKHRWHEKIKSINWAQKMKKNSKQVYMKYESSLTFLHAQFLIILSLTTILIGTEIQVMATTLGGPSESKSTENSSEIVDLGRFAVEQHNKKENAVLEFARVVKAQQQVVAGTLHHLTIEVIDAGKKKLYDAKVWVKPWLNFKDLQEFKHVGDSPTLTSSDLGYKRGHAPGWKVVPAHDPAVQHAANHAITSIQQRSNSLLPYVLKEIMHAKAEVIDEFEKYNMLLKVKRGEKEEKFNVEVHRKKEGGFLLNHMEQDHS
ncbi:hypothetical protein Dsin_000544 [Dipteronia sinensis]|uniref:Cysteine proteinase inhibitor n=1 Tax=Dipteronia sinensis TaxID=43782 RepID=A0AAE0B310_9ROSI|nr:hypothetical protein Dsin_000544 [Dipteronia sinensis]